MISMPISEAALAMGGELFGSDQIFDGVSTDSREIQSGELFFALKGEHFDGHDMCATVNRLGAVASVVEKDTDTPLPFVKVKDTRAALGDLAQHWRNKFPVKVVGVTGSNGKTTTKEMLASILSHAGNVLATKGNFNNEIGLPKTLFELSAEHEFVVVEMGANHSGEIARLAKIANPHIGIITLCAPAHLEGFGSIEGVAKAKGEIFANLSEKGVAIINADDDYCEYWCEVSGERRQLKFGLTSQSADIFATEVDTKSLGGGTSFKINFEGASAQAFVPHDGIHNVLNALAAGAAALALGCTIEQVITGLAQSSVVSGRLNILRLNDWTQVIDDTYNANPASLMAAVSVAAAGDEACWVVMGDMGELGADGQDIHANCGREIASLGVERLFTYGKLASAAARTFGTKGFSFEDKDKLLAALRGQMTAFKNNPLTILVKGSRSVKMETVVAGLLEQGDLTC